MVFYAVDLGTTNIKVGLYDEQLRILAQTQARVNYLREQSHVEFDPNHYFQTVLSLLCECAAAAGSVRYDRATIVLTGQAESFVLLDLHGAPLGNGISWMDMRSEEECREIIDRFGEKKGFSVTGQPWVNTTWTATKLRWLRRNQPERLEKAQKILLLKDYIQYCFTGICVGERSIRGFTYYMDVLAGDYWDEMLDFCGVTRAQMPELIPPCSDLGVLLPQVSQLLPECGEYRLNVGTLDHFATVLGVGGFRNGIACESSGTVLSLTMKAEREMLPAGKISFHVGPEPNSYALFHCCDSGGVCFDWIRNHLQMSYQELEQRLTQVDRRSAPVFLPFLTGVNPPEYYPNARGAFLNLTLSHRPEDLAYAVMEGVGCLLRSNVNDCVRAGVPVEALVSVGGGTKSYFWTQLKADLCNRKISVPTEPEMTCRGAALIGAVAAGIYKSYAEAGEKAPPAMRVYHPTGEALYEQRYRLYESMKSLLAPSFIRRKGEEL